MTRKFVFAGAILLALALVVMAADSITGKWTFEQPSRGGGGGGADRPPQVVTLDLKAEGATLTGSILQPMGGRRGGDAAPAAPPAPAPVAIKNGKVNGNAVSFEVERAGRGGGTPTVTKYEGTVSGSEMKLKITRPSPQGGEPTVSEVTAKKATT